MLHIVTDKHVAITSVLSGELTWNFSCFVYSSKVFMLSNLFYWLPQKEIDYILILIGYILSVEMSSILVWNITYYIYLNTTCTPFSLCALLDVGVILFL